MMAIMMLSQSKIYAFIVFFKTWVCILVFGLLNGMVLLPVILSIVGPVNGEEKKDVDEERKTSEIGALEMA